MNYEQANSVKELAPGVKKVLEELEWEHAECNGSGLLVVKKRSVLIGDAYDVPTKCNKCNGTGKLKYFWTPQVGEWFLNIALDNLPHLIANDYCIKEMMDRAGYDENEFIPILEWEEIERVLEKVGCAFRLSDFGIAGDYNYRFEIWAKSGPIQVGKIAKSRQEAVMLAVIELGKELK